MRNFKVVVFTQSGPEADMGSHRRCCTAHSVIRVQW